MDTYTKKSRYLVNGHSDMTIVGDYMLVPNEEQLKLMCENFDCEWDYEWCKSQNFEYPFWYNLATGEENLEFLHITKEMLESMLAKTLDIKS